MKRDMKDVKEQSETVAIVAGAVKGIGLEIALALARRGVRCVLTYYDWLDSLQEMHDRMRKTGTEYVAVNADLTRSGDVRKVADAAEGLGGPDILVNNIERGGWPVVHGPYTEEQWLLEFQTTVTAKWNLFTECMGRMKAKGRGTVINISSISAITGRSGPAACVFNDCYSLASRAVGSLTEQWAREAAPEVRVNELMLGFFETRHGPGTRGWGIMTDEQKQAIKAHTLLERTGRLDDITAAVMFMAFDAPFMTGATIRLDGGFVLGGEDVPAMPKGVVKPGESTFGGEREKTG
jgi:3-oxoacyl-[acyl-carrier protein] reductase